MELDPRLTFESFVVGPANRLAAAAARRAADLPGRSYNPLFLYSKSGLGKSHILAAIAHQSLRLHPDREALYQPLEVYLGELTRALERGDGDRLEKRYAGLQLLLLDDVQFLTGQGEAQEILLRTLDAITSNGGQVVLASDRPPAEIDGLDDRLLSRFSGGLIVDMGPPDMETRVAILRRKSEERRVELASGVPEALARFPFRNVREMQGALNRVFAVQELEERIVEEDELRRIVGVLTARPSAEGDQDAGAEAPAWRTELRLAVDAAQEEGFAATRLERLLRSGEEPDGWAGILRGFRDDLGRMREIRAELDELGNPWPEAAATLLVDPDRLEESEALVASARERARPFAGLPDGPRLDELGDRFPPLAVRAASGLIAADRPEYNPLYLHDADPERVRILLEAVGRSYLDAHADARVGSISVAEFAEEFIRAISDGVAGAWRERWWTVDVLLLHGLEALPETERAQEEFFHLFEALKRRDARMFLGADRGPAEIQGVHDRLRSRFEGGLVVELEGESLPVPAAPAESGDARSADSGEGPPAGAGAVEPVASGEAASAGSQDPVAEPARELPDDDLAAVRELAGIGRATGDVLGMPAPDEGEEEGEGWRPSPERVVWEWPEPADRIVEAS